MNASPSSIPPAPPPASSSSTPIRAASAEGASLALTPIARRCAATRPRRSAASSPSTARSDADAARAIAEIFTEVIIAPDATGEAVAIVGAQEEPAATAGRRSARPARLGSARRGPWPVVCSCSRATMRCRRHDAQGRDQAPADQGGAARSASSLFASPSTSSRTPSSTRRIGPPSASALGRWAVSIPRASLLVRRGRRRRDWDLA